MKIVSFNFGQRDGVSTLKNKAHHQNLCDIIDQFDPDILFFQELNLDGGIHLKEYWEIDQHSLAIFLKKKHFRDVETVVPDEVEDRCLYVKAKFQEFSLLLVCVHTPKRDSPSKGLFYRTNNLNHCKNLLEGKIMFKSVVPDIIFLAGDFNTNFYLKKNGERMVLNTRSNPLCKNIKNLVTNPRQDTTLNGQCIDGIFCRFLKGVVAYETKTVPLSKQYDHFLLVSKISFETPKDSVQLQEKCNLINTTVSKEQELKTESDGKKDIVEAILVGGEYRAIITGPQGGKYYFGPSYHKNYVKDSKKILEIERTKVQSWSFKNPKKSSK